MYTRNKLRQTVVAMKSTVFLDVMLCSHVEVYGRFGRMYWLHFQSQIRQTSNQQETGSKQNNVYFPYLSTLKMEAILSS
jgi:hypothetical protein